MGFLEDVKEGKYKPSIHWGQTPLYLALKEEETKAQKELDAQKLQDILEATGWKDSKKVDVVCKLLEEFFQWESAERKYNFLVDLRKIFEE